MDIKVHKVVSIESVTSNWNWRPLTKKYTTFKSTATTYTYHTTSIDLYIPTGFDFVERSPVFNCLLYPITTKPSSGVNLSEVEGKNSPHPVTVNDMSVINYFKLCPTYRSCFMISLTKKSDKYHKSTAKCEQKQTDICDSLRLDVKKEWLKRASIQPRDMNWSYYVHVLIFHDHGP